MSSALDLGFFIYPTPHHQRLSKTKSSKSINILGVEQTQTCFGAVLDPQLTDLNLRLFLLEGSCEWGWITPLLFIYLPNRLSPGLHRRPKESKTCKNASIGISKGPGCWERKNPEDHRHCWRVFWWQTTPHFMTGWLVCCFFLEIRMIQWGNCYTVSL